MDHVWLKMRSHAQGETRVHFGELGRVEVGSGDNNIRGPRRPLAQQRAFQGLKGKGAAPQGPVDGPVAPQCPRRPRHSPRGRLAAPTASPVPMATTSCGA